MSNKRLYSKRTWFLFTFLLLFYAFSPLTLVQSQSQSINLNGVWKSSFGSTVTISQSGGVIKGTIKESKVPSRVGATDMRGNIEGGSIKGEVYLRAENRLCSFLDGYFPATGTVSPNGNIITFTWENHIYNDETCNFTGEIRQGTLTYTKIILQGSITPPSTAIQTITLQPTISFQTEREILGYAQAFVDKPPSASDFQEVPLSDFIMVYPSATISAVPNPATPSANIKDNIFIGKVGGGGEIVIGLPNGGTTVLKDDKSAYDGELSDISWRFGNNPPPERPSAYQVKISDESCETLHARALNNTCDFSHRCRYAEIWDVQTPVIYRKAQNCTYESEGAPSRILVERGNATLKTPGDVVATSGNADFGIGYDTKSGTSIVEAYNGSVKVSNKSGQTKKISTVYGSKIKRIEVDKNGTMTEKTAIPQSQWQAFLASNQKKEKANAPILLAIIVLGAGGFVLFLYRTGKLAPLYKTSIQRVSEFIKRASKKQKTD